ncbi:hypothetical protein W822_15635 [Advenella kashmirensis W13003]|uniref:Uncharacterized protein n=1 Tax=Advenella kashmirensis W13003 TaxID=1424334 RepID=V8QTT9_9BURK|nr:hypothetical protein [Advenella kashmirensis]ETF02429.1 hypothetical protein W822_15635 [Advenella kashmirensis W13003]
MIDTNEIKPIFAWLMQVANEGAPVGIHDVQLSDDDEFPNKTKVLVTLTNGQYNIAMAPFIPEHERDTTRTSVLITLSGFLESVKAVRMVLKELQGAFNE